MKLASSCTLWYKFARVCKEEEEVRYACIRCFGWFDDSWRIMLWRILLYLEDIAILGDFAILWSLDYDALALG